jgi:hypothetical protein
VSYSVWITPAPDRPSLALRVRLSQRERERE